MNKSPLPRFTLCLLLALTAPALGQTAAPAKPAPPAIHITWRDLTPLPDPLGVAGPFAGVSNGALIVAGGANFPEGPPWQGHPKAYYDRIYILEHPDGKWRLTAEKLPRPLAYGVSISTLKGLICIGGSNAKKTYRSVFLLQWKDGHIQTTDMPDLPIPLDQSCGAIIGDVVYIAGGDVAAASTAASTHFLALDLSKENAQWRDLPTWPGPGRILPVAGAMNHRFYLFGGAELLPGIHGEVTRKALTDAYQYTPDKGWSRQAKLPHPIAAAPTPAAPIGSFLIIPGGDDRTAFGAPQNHPGFSHDLLAYDIATNAWIHLGTIPHPRVVTPLVPWAGGYVIPNGERRPGVRSPDITLMTAENAP